jgi:hypothetical protein
MVAPVRPPAGGVIRPSSARRSLRSLVLDLPTVMLVCKQGRRAGTSRHVQRLQRFRRAGKRCLPHNSEQGRNISALSNGAIQNTHWWIIKGRRRQNIEQQ